MLRDGGELRLAAAQLVHLRGDLPVLGGNFLQQGGKLVIGLRLLRMLQVESIQRADDALRQTIGQQPRQRNGDKHGRNGRAQHAQQDAEHGITRSGQPEHRAVLQAAGIVERLLGQRRGIALALTCAVAQGVSHLGARGMVLHLRGGGLVVIADGAVGADPGDADLRDLILLQRAQVVLLRKAAVDGMGHGEGLALQLRAVLHGIVVIKHDGQQRHAQQEHDEGHQKNGPENSFCHTAVSRRR